VPAFFVPLYLLTHIAIFAGLAASVHEEASLGSGETRHLPAR